MYLNRAVLLDIFYTQSTDYFTIGKLFHLFFVLKIFEDSEARLRIEIVLLLIFRTPKAFV